MKHGHSWKGGLDNYVPEPNSGCWLWLGSVDSSGYGTVNIGGRVRSTHRVSYERAVGPIPDGLQIDHLCRVRSCINPAHLEAVTKTENMLRGNSPMAKQARMTHCVRGHAFDESNTYRRPEPPARICRSCIRNKYRRTRGLAAVGVILCALSSSAHGYPTPTARPVTTPTPRATPTPTAPAQPTPSPTPWIFPTNSPTMTPTSASSPAATSLPSTPVPTPTAPGPVPTATLRRYKLTLECRPVVCTPIVLHLVTQGGASVTLEPEP